MNSAENPSSADGKRLEAASTWAPAAPPAGGQLFLPFDPSEPVEQLSGNLPHLRQKGATYFVTFRTADSLPKEKLSRWLAERTAWIAAHPEPQSESERREYYELFPNRLQVWLDQGYGEQLLARPEWRELVEGALRFFDQDRYQLGEFVVMSNHVHALVTPWGEHELSDILHSWKSFTATRIHKSLGRTGAFWQKESFDHIVRNADSLRKYEHYIRENPRAGRQG